MRKKGKEEDWVDEDGLEGKGKRRGGFFFWIREEERKEEDLEDVTLQDPRFGSLLLSSDFRLKEFYLLP